MHVSLHFIGGCTTYKNNSKDIERPDQIISVGIVGPTLQLLQNGITYMCSHGLVNGLGKTLVEG